MTEKPTDSANAPAPDAQSTPAPSEAPAATEATEAADNVDVVVRRNTLVTMIGTVGKVGAPLYLALAIRLYGVEAFGVFATAQVFCEMGMSFLTAGFNDAALMHSSNDRDTTAKDREKREQALGTAMLWVVLLCLVILFPAALLAPWLLGPFFSYADELGRALQWMALGVPFFGLSRMMVATTIGHQDMRYDAAVNGFARPFGLLFFALTFYFIVGSPLGLAIGWTVAQFVAFLVSWHGFRRYARLPKLYRAVRRRGIDPLVVRFAIPQSLSVTFQRFAAGMDVVMLGALGAGPAITGIYAVAVQVAENAVNTVRFIFVNVFNPWVPHYTRRRDPKSLSELMTKLTVRSTLVTTLIAVGVLAFEKEVMSLFVPGYETFPLTMAMLIAAPLLLGVFGLAGSVIVLSGHSRLNLVNAVTVTTVNFVLNLLFIPIWGHAGAALGTLLGMWLLVGLQLVEAKKFVGVSPRWLALAPSLLVSALSFGAILSMRLVSPAPLWLRAACFIAAAGVLGIGLRFSTPRAALTPPSSTG